ncbi:cation diffusion facilitator family transporter [Clostridium sp. UBA871]|uniref:cation diffusion facilitator family transporter n=1 Tax=Clostridium sp. UBA871 TaxID=1946380 RepID=UPI003216EE5C
MDERTSIGVGISKNTILVNAILGTIKVLVGIMSSSNAMIADGIHSFSDVISTIGVIIGLKLSNKPDDKCHPYGHERIESISSLFLSIMLFVVAISIGYSGIKNIVLGEIKNPGILAIWAAILSIIVKEWMYFYTIKYANKINSSALRADAWHHRSDSFSSVGALIGIIGARMGWPILDSVVAIVICVVIIKVACDVLKQSVNQLIDTSADEEIISDINEKLQTIEGVRHIDSIKTRQHANRVYVDVEVSVDSKLTVEEGHDIAINIHHGVEKNNNIKHCMVHINPYKYN